MKRLAGSSANVQGSKKKPFPLMLKAYLYVLLFINGFAAITTYLLLSNQQKFTGVLPQESMAITIIIAIATVIAVLVLLEQKKLGLYIYSLCVIASAFLSFHLTGSIAKTILGLANIPVLFIIFHIGGKRKAWDRMT